MFRIYVTEYWHKPVEMLIGTYPTDAESRACAVHHAARQYALRFDLSNVFNIIRYSVKAQVPVSYAFKQDYTEHEYKCRTLEKNDDFYS